MRLRLWSGIVVAASAGGAAYGWAIGSLLARVSGDYVVTAAGYASAGLRAGLLAGTVLAASNLMASRPLLGPESVARAFMMSAMVAVGIDCAGAVAGLLLPLVLDTTAGGYSLGHPRRYALFLALDRCWLAAILLGAVAGSHWSWRERCNRDAVRERQPEQEVDRK